MRVHPGRLALATAALAALGAVAGAALCWTFLAAYVLLTHGAPAAGGLPQALLGSALWATAVGGPAGAVSLPLLGLTVLRRVPLGHALGGAGVGALAALLLAALLVPSGAVWPVPLLVPALGLGGLLAGACSARIAATRLNAGRAAGRLRA